MAHRHRRAFEPQRERKRPRAKKKPAATPADEQSIYPHPVFGPIPMVPVSVVLEDGKVWQGRDYDPDYAPPLPKGAVRGDVRRQEFCRMCHAPKYFYVDIPRRCVECGADFGFTAAEQKQWFEVLKFHFDSIPVRCLACRRKRRSDKALVTELSNAKQRLRAAADSPSAQLAVAEAVVRYRQRTGQGRLSDALAAARKARRLLKDHSAGERAETFYWEAACQALSGKLELARSLYARFLENAGGKRRAVLMREAKSWLPGP